MNKYITVFKSIILETQASQFYSFRILDVRPTVNSTTEMWLYFLPCTMRMLTVPASHGKRENYILKRVSLRDWHALNTQHTRRLWLLLVKMLCGVLIIKLRTPGLTSSPKPQEVLYQVPSHSASVTLSLYGCSMALCCTELWRSKADIGLVNKSGCCRVVFKLLSASKWSHHHWEISFDIPGFKALCFQLR